MTCQKRVEARAIKKFEAEEVSKQIEKLKEKKPPITSIDNEHAEVFFTLKFTDDLLLFYTFFRLK